MKSGLFLGAGASVVFGKPTTFQLKERLVNKYGNTKKTSFLQSFLACPAFNDIEHVLQAVKDLREFLDSYGGKYMKWMGEDQTLIFNMSPYQQQYKDFVNDFANIQATIENEVFENYYWKNISDDDLSTIYDKFIPFLSARNPEIPVFTTNYDRAIEEYCSSSDNLRCIDGFQLNPKSGRFLWARGDYGYLGNNTEGKDVILYKLHGSLNWKVHSKYGMERTSEEWKPNDPNYVENMLIYPTVSPKDGYEREPYKTIRNNFEKQMEQLDRCIAIGFSFRDGHINEVFKKFIDAGKQLVIISPKAISVFRSNFMGQNLTEEQLESWSDLDIVQTIQKNVIAYQKEFNVNAIDDIIGFLKSI